jgi:putative phosphoesterase
MTRIGLLSDTHSWLDPDVFSYFDSCDEVWHAGDLGSMEVLEKLEAFRPTRAVYGNIDNAQIRAAAPENQIFSLDGLSVVMTHIGGYPGRYNARVKELLDSQQPDLYICGHSHILKIIPDKKRQLLHINPGACGNHGFHKMRTIVRFAIQAGKITDLEVVELGKRGQL